MEPDKNLFPVLKTETDKQKTIIENVLLMLSNRIFINKAGEKKQLLDTVNQMEDEATTNG